MKRTVLNTVVAAICLVVVGIFLLQTNARNAYAHEHPVAYSMCKAQGHLTPSIDELKHCELLADSMFLK